MSLPWPDWSTDEWRRKLAASVAFADFDESKHPRDERGRFTDADDVESLSDEHKQLLKGWTDGDYDWSDMKHAARAVIVGMPRDEYVCYDCKGDDGKRYDDAQKLLALAQSRVVGKPLYRGLANMNANAFVEGHVFNESLTSWTGRKELAKDFATGKYGDRAITQQTGRVVMVLEGTEMHGISVSKLAKNKGTKAADEYLTSGKYRVTKVTKDGDLKIAHVVRIGNAEGSRKALGLGTEYFFADWDESKHPRDDDGRFAGDGEPKGYVRASRATIQRVPKSEWEQYRHEHGDDDYYYHVTLNPSARTIVKQQALVPQGGGALMGGASREGHSQDRVFVTERSGVYFWAHRAEDHAHANHDEPPGVAVVRIPKKAVVDVVPDELGTRDALAKAYYVRGGMRFSEALAYELADWDESKHPRDEKGQFTSGGQPDVPPDLKKYLEDFAAFQNDPSIHPLAKPVMLMGVHDTVDQREVSRYLAKHGQEWTPAKLPDGTPVGKPNQCYANATRLLVARDDVDYVEGVAYREGVGSAVGFMHAWVVDREGKVIDNTWTGDTSKNKYFGVKYDRTKYIAHAIRSGFHGVLGSTDDVANRVLQKGGL